MPEIELNGAAMWAKLNTKKFLENPTTVYDYVKLEPQDRIDVEAAIGQMLQKVESERLATFLANLSIALAKYKRVTPATEAKPLNPGIQKIGRINRKRRN